jgi:hypothetical protein
MEYLVTALREHQELTIFLTLAVGFFVGQLRIGTFSLGTVVGTLLAGVLIGQLDIKVPATVKNVFFDLFLFTVGYKVGPQFFPRPQEGRDAAARRHRGSVRHVPGQRVHGIEAPRVRHGNRGWAPGRSLHGVDGHRHRR